MKDIILCDRGNYKETSFLCKKYDVSVNVDTFSETDFLDVYPEEVTRNLMYYNEVKIVAMHGAYKDLCLGSKDPLIKLATMTRFEDCYKISKSLNCSNSILHHGFIPGTSLPSNWVKRAKLFFDEFFIDKDNSITIYIENQLEHTPDLILFLRLYLK